MQDAKCGSVNYLEFKNFLKRMGWCANAEDDRYIEGLFAMMDDDDDGKIGYQEFCRWVKPPDRHENLMCAREDPYKGERGGMSFLQRQEWITSQTGRLCL